MPELLLELFSEEIPARMQMRAAADLKAMVTGGLVDAGLTYEGAQAHGGPRRLVVSVEGLLGVAPESTEERRGPRVDAPDQAIQGFLRSAGVRLEDCQTVEDKKGRFYVARLTKPGRPTPEVIAELVPEVVRRFPWPKSMRWGSGSLRWVRPLHAIVCTFDGETVDFAIDGLRSGNTTHGHRFMAPDGFQVRRFEDYAAGLRQAFVMIDADERAEAIRTEARNLAFAQGFEVVEDEALIRETAGLAEWPVVLMGRFDEGFLDLPPEVIATSLKQHQKCFSLRRRGGGKDGGALANRYLLVSNLVAKDGGQRIVEGNDRVIAARLADARFFWDQDRKTPLETLLPRLEQITFHAKLGNQYERVQRIEALAGEIAETIGADVEKARLAARLAKVDLVTGMVGEFPELQGQMGYYYALAEGHDREVAEAIRDHYKPLGPSDTVPASPVAQAVAIADKLDMLVGFWAIGEKPTGSKDPYALRRAALGVIRIVLENELRMPFWGAFASATVMYLNQDNPDVRKFVDQVSAESIEDQVAAVGQALYAAKVHEFIADRLKVQLREQGVRHDLIDAVFALGSAAPAPSPLGGEGRGGGGAADPATDPTPGPSPRGGGVQDDLLMIVRRVEALGRFLETEDGEHLLTGVKRAVNILRIEEKRDGRSYDGMPDRNLLVQGEEKALALAMDRSEAQARKAVEAEDFEAAMAAIAKLRQPIDDFFDHVTVNTDDPSFRENRLKLLNRIRAATLAVADFSRIEG